MRLLDCVPCRGPSLVLAALVAATVTPLWLAPPPVARPVVAVPVHQCTRSPVPVVRAPSAGDIARYRGHDRATIVTSRGTLHCQLFPELAPTAVASFIGLATGDRPWRDPETGAVRSGRFYDGLTFHRVIPGFVIQGGDPAGNGTGGPGYEFADEIAPDLEIVPGMLAMANKGPNTNGSQFFITDGSPDWLRGHDTIFGKCSELDVVHAIASVPRSSFDRPTLPVVIEHVTIE